MRRRALLIFVLLAASPVHAFPNEPTGFRDIDWGTPVARNQMELQPVNDGEGADFYTRGHDPLTFGKAQLASLSYAYQSNKFVGVMFRTEGADNEEALRGELESKYGPGKRSGNPKNLTMIWDGRTARIEVHCQSKASCTGTIVSSVAYASYRTKESKAAKVVPRGPVTAAPGATR